MIPWLKLRFEERSSWTGIIIGAGALLFILGIHPLSTINYCLGCLNLGCI